MKLIQAAYSSHIRANVRIYETSEDFKVDWQHADGSHGARVFPGLFEAIDYFKSLFK